MTATTKERISERLGKVSTLRLEKGHEMLAIETSPPKVIDLASLEGVEIGKAMFARGQRLKVDNRVHSNSLYPWKFTVSGDPTELGTTLYFVDLATVNCSCLWFENTGVICKHLVAALLAHMENTTPVV